MRFATLGSFVACAALTFAQDAALTVDQIMEKSIEAHGGREAVKKTTSFVAKGTLEIAAMGATVPTEMYAKAPDKRYNLTQVEGYGDIKRGWDGKVGWNDEPQAGLVDLKGDELAAMKRDSALDASLRWKEHYPKSEVTGKGKVGTRDCWILTMTPTEGKPVTRYYDAETFLLVKVIATVDSAQAGSVTTTSELSDYKDIGTGLKMPHTIKMEMPGIGELIIKYKEIKANVDIDDAKFTKPAK